MTNVCVPLYRKKIPEVILKSLGHIKLVENYNVGESFQIDVLIGLDQYWKFVKPDIIPVTEELVAQKTVFGWMLSGLIDTKSSQEKQTKTAHQLLCIHDVQDHDLCQL